MRVRVISKEGKPLTPCTEKRAKHLLQASKAKVEKRDPFTIRLLAAHKGNPEALYIPSEAEKME